MTRRNFIKKFFLSIAGFFAFIFIGKSFSRPEYKKSSKLSQKEALFYRKLAG